MRISSFFKFLNKIPFYLLFFLIPIFFLPLTPNVLDFPKQYLFSILVSISLFGWFGEKIIESKLVLKRNKIFYFFLLILFILFLFSLIFSPSPLLSLFGLPTEITDSFLCFLFFLIFSFLLINSFEKEETFLLIFFFLVGGAIASIFNLLQIYRIFIFPFPFSKSVAFNTIGTPNSFSIFATLLLPLSLILFFRGKRIFKIIFGFLSLVFFLNIIFVNFKLSFFALLIESLIFFIFGFQKEKLKLDFVLISMCLLISSIFFFFFPIIPKGFPILPPEISLSFQAEIYILKKAFSESFKNLFLGTGPSTFVFSYSKYRSPLLNRTIFWGTRFQRGFSTLLDSFLTKGILEGFSLLLFYLFLIFLVFKNLSKQKENLNLKLALGSSLVGSIFFSFLYPLNFTLLFSFWSLVSLFLILTEESKISFDFSLPARSIILNFLFALSLIFAFGTVFFQTKIYLGEFYYLKSQREYQKGRIDGAIQFLKKATKVNPYFDAYFRDLSQLFLAKANLISQDNSLNPQEKARLANLAIVEGADAINKAIEILPFNVANWNVRGFFYRNLIGIEKADQISLSSYQKAIELEPNSPYPFGEKARVYILTAQNLAKLGKEKEKKEKLELAIKNLEEALKLKPDYATAHYLMAVAYDQLGKLDLAISKLEETKKIVPRDFGVAFQLGLLYWRKGEIDKAKKEFERTLSLNSNYQNAKYMLGLVLDSKGEKEKAKEIFEELSVQNPENQELKRILENLEKGFPALEGITTSQPPIQETPPEISK